MKYLKQPLDGSRMSQLSDTVLAMQLCQVTLKRYTFDSDCFSSLSTHFFKLFYIPALVHSLPHTDMSPQAFHIFIHVDVYILKKSTKKINKQHSIGVSSVVNFRLKHSIYQNNKI